MYVKNKLERVCTFIYFISFLLVNSPIIGAVEVSMNFSIAVIPASPEIISCSPSPGFKQTMLGSAMPNDLARFISVEIPNEYLSQFLDARAAKVDWRW